MGVSRQLMLIPRSLAQDMSNSEPNVDVRFLVSLSLLLGVGSCCWLLVCIRDPAVGI